MARGDRFFHYPTRTVYDRPEEHGLIHEDMFFTNGDGHRLHGWFFPAVGTARGTLVHCHGNAGNVTGHYRFVAWLPERGWNVFCFDYRGFGRSEGRPTREGTAADTHAAIDAVKQRSDVNADRIVLLGQSLGGAVAIIVASDRDDLAGLAVEGAYASHRAEARFICRRTWWLWGVSALVPRVFVAAGHDPIDYVHRIGPIPKMFICGTGDGIVDYRQTVALHDAAGEPKELWILEDGGHTGALIDDEPDAENSTVTKRDRFYRFLDRCVNQPEAHSS
jgi:fermentation-respiration switch protein FrsA (DUF1100 family)